MRLQMVHRHVGQSVRDRDPFSELAADDQTTDQSRPAARRHAAKVAESDAGTAHYATDLVWEHGQMRPSRDLGHNAAIGRMLTFLAQHRLGQYAPGAVEHRRR